MNLLESLQKTQTQRAQQPIPGQAANLRQMLASKSGKAGVTSGPAISSVGEQQALKDFGQAATTQQQAAQLDVGQQKQQQAAQQQQTTQAIQDLGTQQQQIQQKYDQQVQKVSNDLARVQNDINSREGRQALAEALFTRGLADEKYLKDLNREGQVRRLQDRQAFALEAGKTAFENWKELFRDEQEFAKIMDMDEAEFKKGLARMGVDAARAVVASSIESANRTAQWSAMGNFGTAAVKAGATEYTTTNEDTGQTTTGSFFDRISSGKDLTNTETQFSPGVA